MDHPIQMTLAEVQSLVVSLLLAQGFNDRHANAIARTVTAAERDECRHHGLFRIPFYVNALRAGQASGSAEPSVTRLAKGIVKVDAFEGFSPLALEVGDAPLAALAKEQGIAALAINNALSVSALWPEVERLANQGLVGFAFVAASPYVAPAGGSKPLYGTNPMAFAWPRPGGLPPVVFDQASSASARGEIQVRLRDGRALEEGWAVGPDGQPTTDPALALAGAQLPFGGVKGAAIAMMVELLAGPLVGDLLSYEAGEKDVANTGAPCGGELIIAIDPAQCLSSGDAAAQLAHGERLFEKILEQPGTRLPSQRRYEARVRSDANGISLPRSLYETLLHFRDGRYDGKRNAYEGDDALKAALAVRG